MQHTSLFARITGQEKILLRCILIYSGTLVCEHNSFQKRARNPKHSYIKANFPIRNNRNSDDSLQN
jgi:hypothetical protein